MALLAAEFIGPLVSLDTRGWVPAAAILVGAALHAIALCLVRNVEDYLERGPNQRLADAT